MRMPLGPQVSRPRSQRHPHSFFFRNLNELSIIHFKNIIYRIYGRGRRASTVRGAPPRGLWHISIIIQVFKVLSASYNPFAARQFGYTPCGNEAAHVGKYSYRGNRQPYWQKRIRKVAINKYRCDVAKEEKVHEIHAERQAGSEFHKSWRAFASNTAEHQKCSECGAKHVWRAKLPRPFKHWRFDGLARNSNIPERPTRKGGSCKEA